MAWHIEGRYVENCNCDVICPCTWSNLSRPATGDDCPAVLAFRVENGDVDGVDVSGRIVVLVIQTPKLMGGTTVGAGEAHPVSLTGIVAHPAGPTLTVPPSASVRWSLLGIDYSGEDRSFSAPFAWAA